MEAPDFADDLCGTAGLRGSSDSNIMIDKGLGLREYYDLGGSGLRVEGSKDSQ